MKFFKFESLIARHWLCALINGDYSGLTTEECVQLNAWREKEESEVKSDGLTVGHWATTGEDDEHAFNWATCQITGLKADCEEVVLCAYRSDNGGSVDATARDIASRVYHVTR